MPIVENDPWRKQYFENSKCPDEVFVPTEDGDCYKLYPEHRWIYNKLLIAESHDFACGLHGIAPETFPVFSKAVYNMRGMGTDSLKYQSISCIISLESVAISQQRQRLYSHRRDFKFRFVIWPFDICPSI